MAYNRYAQDCDLCGVRVAAKAGSLDRSGGRWVVTHLACRDSGAPQVVATTFYGEHGPSTVYRNVRGRCEDAPCCGCCS